VPGQQRRRCDYPMPPQPPRQGTNQHARPVTATRAGCTGRNDGSCEKSPRPSVTP
jgi:hypothetical protein